MTSFKKNLLIGYSVSILLLVASSIASYISINNLLESSKHVRETNNAISALDDISLAVTEGEGGQRGYLMTGNNAYLIPYTGAHERAMAGVDKIKTLLIDDAYHVSNINRLRNLVENRFALLQKVIDDKNVTGEIDSAYLEMGRKSMLELRTHLSVMEKQEQKSLEDRTAKLNKFAASTPVFIILASLVAILITIVSFLKVNSDFDKRVEMQKELEQKDAEITQRITIIDQLANKIADGEYQTRIDDAGQDKIGSLALSLNTMASNLESAFKKLSDTEWQQTGIAQINEQLIGEKNIEELSRKVVGFLTEYLEADLGAFYLSTDQQNFTLHAAIGFDHSTRKSNIIPGEGIAGRCITTRKPVHVKGIHEEDVVITYAAGAIRPVEIIAVPIFFENILKGIIELGFIRPLQEETLVFLRQVGYSIGNAIHSARDHRRLQELLEETQAQSEELQAQHSELENINTELEAQSERLQASEEELRVQQEELQQANQELEERSRMLEDRNEMIQERNLEIQAKAEELELSTRYKSEFLANMSHELRTPLNSILLLSRLLSENHEKNLSEEQIDYAKVIQGSGNGLLRLIDEILDLSKIESGKMELEYHPVSINEIVSDLNNMFLPVAKEKNLDFKIITSADTPTEIETDRLRLEQVIRNLLANALKFTTEGSVVVQISTQGKNIRFDVKDTGIGIARDKQKTVFEAFQQADGSTRRKFGGTGLGLSISRELAKLLGGEIKLESEEGKGSTFSLIIPMRKGIVLNDAKPLKEEPVLTEEPLQSKKQENPYLSINIPEAIPDDRERIRKGDKVILIIEDDTAFAKSLLDYTRKKGYKGVVAVRGDEGIELAKSILPTGILLDVQLPVMSGWEVMDELKNDPQTKPIPVHMMSSHEVRTRSLTSGAVDFINKPVAFDKMNEIFSKIEHALSREPKKVLIVEENPKHAEALAYFLDNFNVHSEIKNNVSDGIEALGRNDVDCVILDMGVPAQHSYETLEAVKKTQGLENLPIIIFTGKNLSNVEEMRIKKYADSIIIKTAHSYQRILDEVSLFLHLVEENKKDKKNGRYKKMGSVEEVLKGKTVLIADDDVRNIFSLTRSLEHYGIKVISAMDGKDAIKQLEANPEIEVVLMDMMMPEMDGYESTSRIRAIPKYRNLPIIAVTAKAMTGDREKCISAGASDYITKPVDPDQLISLLRVWLYNGQN